MELVFLGICIIVNYMLDRKWYSPAFVFSIFWFFTVFLSKVHLFGLYDTSSFVYMIVTIGVISFTVGSIVYRRIPVIYYKKKPLLANKDRVINWRLMDIAFYISLVGSALLAVESIQYIVNGAGLSDIRYVYHDEIFGNYIYSVIYMFIAYPIVYMYILLLGICIVHEQDRIKSVLIRVIILTCLSLLVAGNQRTFFFLLVAVAFSLFLAKDKYKISKKVKRGILITLIFVFVAVIAIRGSRGGESIFESINNYFAGCLVYFSRFIENREPDYTIVASSFQGFLRPIAGILEKLGRDWKLFDKADDFQYLLQEKVYYISNNKFYNYFSSCFAFFYNDLGILGVVIYSFIYGCLCKDAYIKYNIHKSSYRYGILIFYLSTILLQSFAFVFVRTEIAYALVFFVLFSRNKKRTYLIK